MRETRLSGSEGGAVQQCAVPTPILPARETMQAIAFSFAVLLPLAVFFSLVVLLATRLTATAEKYTLAWRHAQA
jgi:hypothetical protein